MQNPLTKKLESFADFSDADRVALDRLCDLARNFPARAHLIHEGDRPESVFFMLSGWAYRYKTTNTGARQIVAYLMPGDLCDLNIFILSEMDHGIALLSDARVAAVPKNLIRQIMAQHSTIAEAFLWSTLVDEATLREWLLNVGQRDAYQSIAHLFCELWIRMRQNGLADGHRFFFPITQEQLGDTVGITPVHANRTIRRMREDGLIALSGSSVEILNVDALKEAAGFSSNYLHLNRRI